MNLNRFTEKAQEAVLALEVGPMHHRTAEYVGGGRARDQVAAGVRWSGRRHEEHAERGAIGRERLIAVPLGLSAFARLCLVAGVCNAASFVERIRRVANCAKRMTPAATIHVTIIELLTRNFVPGM